MLTKNPATLLAIAIAVMLALPALADPVSPAGRWQTVDDNTKKPRSFVTVVEVNGQLEGTIDKLIVEPGEDPAPKCDKCEGSRHNQPVVGMKILWGLTKDGDKWGNGRILDPENGKTYKCWVRVTEDGKRLEVRGFFGFSAIGRTQYWLKAE